MKLITVIIRPEKLDELIRTLIDNGARGLTVTEVRGFGQQYGQLAASWTKNDHLAATWVNVDPAGVGLADGRKPALLPKMTCSGRFVAG